MLRVLTIPGLWNSGPEHWQTNWERERGDARRVLAAHSLGCCTVAHLARDAASAELARVCGALLVAPSDVEAPSYPAGTEGFAPMPLARLPFACIVVGSSNDEYVAPSARAPSPDPGARATSMRARA